MEDRTLKLIALEAEAIISEFHAIVARLEETHAQLKTFQRVST